MGAVNVQQGRASRVYGLPEIQKRLREISDAFVKKEAEMVISDATLVVYDALRSHAASVNVPRDARADIFMYTRQPNATGKADRVTAVAGMRKLGRGKDAKGYRKWFAGRQVGAFEKTEHNRKKGRGKLTMPGTQIGENLGTMWEFGTTKMPAKPWARPAVQSSRSTVLSKLVAGYNAILQRHGA